MRKKLALLGFLMLVSVGMAYIVSASDALKARATALRSLESGTSLGNA